MKFGPPHEKVLILLHANNNGTDQPAWMHRLISAFFFFSGMKNTSTSYTKTFEILASLNCCAEMIEPNLVAYPEGSVSRAEIHYILSVNEALPVFWKYCNVQVSGQRQTVLER